jgi:hypothetical protein
MYIYAYIIGSPEISLGLPQSLTTNPVKHSSLFIIAFSFNTT